MATPKITRVSKIVKVSGEYVVKAWVGENGQTRYPEGDYFTTDKQDAKDTAALMVSGVNPESVAFERMGDRMS